MTDQIQFLDSIHLIDSSEWNRATRGPFFSHEWFQFLEAIDADNLQPRYLMLRQNGRLVAALPVFSPRGRQNTYENYFLGQHKDKLLRLPWFRRRPLVCFVPYTGGAYLFSDNLYREDVLQPLAAALEKEALRGGFTEIVFMCIKQHETLWLDLLARCGYRRVYLNAVGIVRNTFASFEDYLGQLDKRQRKTVKGDLRAFRKRGCTMDNWSSDAPDIDAMLKLIANIDRRYPSILRNFSKRSLTACFDHMRPYRKHYGVLEGDLPIGCLTHFEKDRLIYTYALGIDFDKARASRTYFNLLYYQSIRQMIALKAPQVNFNQMAYKVKESRGCNLVPQYMLVKVLRGRWWTTFWLQLLDYRYRRKFTREYGRNQASHRQRKPQPAASP